MLIGSFRAALYTRSKNRPNFRQVFEYGSPGAQEYSNCKPFVLFHTLGRLDIAAPGDGSTPKRCRASACSHQFIAREQIQSEQEKVALKTVRQFEPDLIAVKGKYVGRR